MIHALFFVLCLVHSYNSHGGVHGIQHTLEEDLELEKQLQLINKSPVKSIHTKYGYIVDCIDIYKQPAFDHPLLKDHKLQRKSSFQNSFEKTGVKNSSTKSIFGLEKDECPRGSVPIRRTTKDNLIQSKLLSNNHDILVNQDVPGLHLAEVYLIPVFSPYYKVNGTTSIYNPPLTRDDQMSLSHIWVQNGPIDDINKISFGWHVAPKFYGDSGTHIYTSWTSDNFKKTGCFNLYCSGFVQTHPGMYIGARLEQMSIYGGTMSETTIAITQDPTTKNWWLNIMGDDIGYFPSKLFSNMTSAEQVGWGGRTLTPPNTASPPMGSGYFPDQKFVHACYFTQVSFQNASRQDYGPEIYVTDTFNDKSDCYGVEYYGDLEGAAGYSLEFGGPGGNCGN